MIRGQENQNTWQTPNFSFWERNVIPLILQSEKAECALACLCMVAGFWGHPLDIAGMRRKFAVSTKGTSLKNLINMASELGFQSRPVRLELSSLSKLATPAILHWSLNHFVVLKSVKNSYAIIHDPATGIRKLSIKEVSNYFTGVALELTPSPSFKKIDERQKFSLMSLMGRVVGLKRGLLRIFALGVVLQIIALAGPFYMQWLIDDAVVTSDENLVTILGIGFACLLFIQCFVAAMRSWVGSIISTKLNFQWLDNSFIHLTKLPMSYFEKRHAGDVVSRFGSIQTIQQIITTQFVEGLIDGILVVGTLIFMLLYSVQLTSVAFFAVGLFSLVKYGFYHTQRNAFSDQIIHSAKQKTHFLETIRGIQSLRLFNRLAQRRSGWLNSLVDQYNAELKIAKLSLSLEGLQQFIYGLERIVILWIGALAVIHGKISVGMLFAFLSYKEQFSVRLSALISKIFDWKMAYLHGERVADIVLTPIEERDASHVELYDVPQIEFRNISFRYADGEPFVLQDFNLKVPPGEFLVITGSSGCGKTTLIKILLGILTPTQGEIFVNDMPLANIGYESFRNIVGSVMQDDCLFTGTIGDNISFFDEAPNQTRIEECARLANVYDEIQSMPMGFLTLIGDLGSGLSGGQKQRILLARALYMQPKVIVLDEATSHLDIENERLVSVAVRKTMRTRITVAHRPETIQMADRVVVLEQGKIVQEFLQEQGEQYLTIRRA